MKLSKTIATSVFASVLMFTLPACEQQGPVEEAGEAIDDKAEDAGDAIEDTADGG